MVQIAGKYQVVEGHNFAEFLAKNGVPEDKAKIASDSKTILEVTVAGKKIALKSDGPIPHTTELIVDGETEEKFGPTPLKNFSKLNGNVLTVESKGADGKSTGKRTYTFSDKGLEVAYLTTDNFAAKRIYKRI